MKLRISWAMTILAVILTVAAGLQGCGTFSSEQQERIASIQGEIISLVDKVATGELTITQAKEIAAKRQLELEALKESGLSVWGIIAGLLGAFVAGAIGIKSPGVPTLLKTMFGQKAAA